MERRPKVSIGMPVYNGERLLPRALDSILEQDFQDLEVVISDDASTDSTEELCREYARKDPRVRYFRNAQNLTLWRNFNRAFELSEGEYFKWAAQDDWIAPNYVSACLKPLEADPDGVLSFSQIVFFDENNRILGTRREKLRRGDSASPAVRFHHTLWSIRARSAAEYGLARRSALAQTGLLRNTNASPRIMISELSLLGKVYYVEEPLFFRYWSERHSQRSTLAYLDPANAAKKGLWVLKNTSAHLQVLLDADVSAVSKALMATDLIAYLSANKVRRRYRTARHWFSPNGYEESEFLSEKLPPLTPLEE